MTSMVGLLLGLLLGLCGLGGTRACSIAGPWHYHGEQYLLKMAVEGAATGNLTVTVVDGHQGGCNWCTARGMLGADGSLEMYYDGLGESNKGKVSADCKSFSWGWTAGTGKSKPLAPGPACVPHPAAGPTPPPTPPPEPYADIKVVHVINSCHLDIGFADSSQVGIRCCKSPRSLFCHTASLRGSFSSDEYHSHM